MLVKKEVAPHVEFVSYSGRYPYLCEGVLILKIDGEEYAFGQSAYFPAFWNSGGWLGCEEDTYQGEWKIYESAIPEQFRMYSEEIDKVFNNNVEFGCCGGCL